MVLPLFTLISAVLLATQGKSIFYRGARVGLDGRIFHILKFRTLDGEKAKLLTRGGVLPPGTGIETPLGGMLRDTRLDELPQLLNVVLGDMNLCGPRPVRPEIAEIYRLQIPNYDARFSVKPGLLGPTQAYMHHGASKIIRGRYNQMLYRSPVNYANEIAMVFLVGCCVLARGATHVGSRILSRITGATPDRAVERARDLNVAFRSDDGVVASIVAMDDETVSLPASLVVCPRGETASGRLTARLPDGKLRHARIHLDPIPGQPSQFRYRPASDVAQHMISRYFMQKVVVPHKSHLPLSGMSRAVSAVMRPARRTVEAQAA